MKFTFETREIVYDGASESVSGDPLLVGIVNDAIEAEAYCSCNYWAPVQASLKTEWEAYLTICGAITRAFDRSPDVDRVPDNPAGYIPEGPQF